MSDPPLPRRWDALRDLQREVGRLFETFAPLTNWRIPRQFPAINLYDAGGAYLVTVELPGHNSRDLELTLNGADTLTLRGERKRDETIADESYRRQERPFGRWSRTVPLPGRVDPDRVSAVFALGVLTVNLPKVEESQPRQIMVRSAAD